MAGTRKPRVLFLAAAHASPYNGVYYLRCVLPSEWGGYDRAVLELAGRPSRWRVRDGDIGGFPFTSVGGRCVMPDFGAYDVIVLERNSTHPWWRSILRRWRSNGTKILVDVDEYVHGVRDLPEPPLRVSRRALEAQLDRYDALMREADGLICATSFLADRYSRFAPTYLAPSGCDTRAHTLPRPRRDHVVVGWHGSVLGHELSMSRWMPAVEAILRRHPDVHFVSLGERDYASDLGPLLGDRCRHVSTVTLKEFPAAVNGMDVVLAPAAHIDLFRGKSDQRWLTAAALGIPTVVDPFTYAGVQDEVTGLHATTAADAERQLERLVTDAALRRIIGKDARVHVRRERDISVAVNRWHEVFAAAAGDPRVQATAA